MENTPHVLNSIQQEQVQVPNRERDKFNNNYKEISKDITLFKKFVRQETKKYFSSLIQLLNCNSPIFTHFFLSEFHQFVGLLIINLSETTIK